MQTVNVLQNFQEFVPYHVSECVTHDYLTTPSVTSLSVCYIQCITVQRKLLYLITCLLHDCESRLNHVTVVFESRLAFELQIRVHWLYRFAPGRR